MSEIDGDDFTVRRTASFAPGRAPAGGGPVRPGSVVLSDGGELLLESSSNGVLAIGTDSLRVQRRDLAGWAVDALVASADGRHVSALSSSRGRMATIDPASGDLFGERPVPTATILLHAAPA